MLQLTQENYFSKEASLEYVSVSQYKSFFGTRSIKGCEECALSMLRGDWKQEMSTALLVGSYVDSHFEGTLNTFMAQHPDMLTKQGELRSEYRKANDIIKRIERDEYFMKCMSGQKQIIFTGEIFGLQWKGKLDSFIPKKGIFDLKIMASIRDKFWARNYGWMSFVEHYGYDIQGAIYQKLVEINTGKKLPFFLCVASKETYTDIEVIGFDQEHLDMVLNGIFLNIVRINDLKSGTAIPTRCEECDYCHATKVLRKPIHFKELVN